MFKRIMLILDGLETSTAAAEFALKMASELDSTVIALYVIDTQTTDYLFQQHVLHKDEREEMEKNLESSADYFLSYLQKQGLAKHVEVACISRKGRLSQISLQLAREIEASVLVLGGSPASANKNDFAVHERSLLAGECTYPLIIIR